jgi:predicted RNA-binding Zn-ribbon protein involved in translation (DUF1610 family)
MIRRRERYNPLAPSPKACWLIVWDMQFHVLDATELAPHTDLATLMQATARQWSDAGWEIESDARYGSFFCRRAGERRLIAISAADPSQRTGGGPSWYEGCPTCGE